MNDKKYFGFTLLELLITLTIISILAAIAYPIYSTHIIKAHRTEAQIALMQAAAKLERYYIENNYSYANATLAKLKIDTTTAEGFYALMIPTITNSSYFLQATPIGKQARNDLHCGSLTLNNLGQQGISGTGKPSECW